MNTGYLIYQAERPRSAAEQRQADIAHAELARAVSRGWHTLTAPLRALRARRQGRHQPGLAPRLAPEYQAAEGLATDGLATECLSGRSA
jgi:hypothetical protein